MDKVRTVLELRHVSKIYGSGHTAVTATDDVNLAIRPGEIVLIMGPLWQRQDYAFEHGRTPAATH